MTPLISTAWADLCSALHRPSRFHWRAGLCALLAASLLAGCANPAIKEATDLSQTGQYEAAYRALDTASREHPQDLSLTLAKAKQRDITTAFLIYQAQSAYAAGALDEARALLVRLEAISPGDPRAAGLYAALDRLPRHRKLMAQAQADYDHGQYDRSADALHAILNEDGSNLAARNMLARVDEQREAQMATMASSLKTADKVINLEFREAPLRTVFEALSRAADVNFVFDKDVRTDAKVSLFLRNTTVDEAMRVILSTQQLDRKLLNDNSVLIYPNNAQKQREHQELVTRSFYLVNADAKQAQNLVRTMTKSRDIFVDDRLNLMVVRDTPEVMRVVERLIESLDLPESEVMLEVEILEVSSSTIRTLGLNWPSTASYGLPNAGNVNIATGTDGLRAFTANPLLLATLTGSTSNSNVLATPKIRARNHEKAKVQIGQKLPVFTTTATANVGTTSSVSYLDVGLKVEVEPSIQLDGDVIMKVALEVSTAGQQVTGPDNNTAYIIGNRLATTSLRLKDGETQVLAGLIQDTDSRGSSGVPGLSEVPGAGALFGKQNTDREKTELVMLITPHIVRNTTLPALAGSPVPSGTDTQPGAASMRIRPGKPQVSGQSGQAGGMSSTLGRGTNPGDGDGLGDPAAQQPAAANEPTIGGPQEAMAGAAFSVTISNPTDSPVSTDLIFDTSVLSSRVPGAQGGRIPIQLAPKGSRSVGLTVSAQAADTNTVLNLTASSNSLSVHVRSAASANNPSAPEPGDNAPPPPRQD